MRQDWPTGTEFMHDFPELYTAFMECLPVKSHTSRTGHFNLWTFLERQHVPSDPGPKMYSGYASAEGARPFGSTPLHMDMSDAINVMCSSEPDPLSDEGRAEGAALWVIYPRAATPHLRTFLRNMVMEQGLTVDDPIHDQVGLERLRCR